MVTPVSALTMPEAVEKGNMSGQKRGWVGGLLWLRWTARPHPQKPRMGHPVGDRSSRFESDGVHGINWESQDNH
jgi:hypothetical protein